MILVIATNAFAQLSPGKLSRPHSHLEGLKKCSNCHKLGSREIGNKCLECHTEISAMRSGGKGLHAGSDFENCVDCHVEHHGEDYELIFWPDGMDGFEHQSASFELTGKHADAGCRACHSVKYVADPGALRALDKDLNRTFLGLDPSCATCHDDVHQGQLTGTETTCTSCHDTRGWKPAPLFDHGQSAFPLTGKHQAVKCDACHRPGGEKAVPVYKPVAHQACTSCHKDPHAGTLGAQCASCHSTEGWLQIQGASFDHSITRYPLVGKHTAVKCGDCHDQGRKKPSFAACADCHADAHAGAARGRPAWVRCEDCHTVNGFSPAAYTLASHAETKYPLRGAHRATPCAACHRPAKKGAAPVLDPEFGNCASCHKDPHRWSSEKPKPACSTCHAEDSWRQVTFDHGATGFPLEGRHLGRKCAECHTPEAEKVVGFADTPQHCASCHDDVHRGQFESRRTPDGAATDCAACHVATDWFAEKFDHEQDSRFSLKGGHEKVACGACHLPVTDAAGTFAHFKPLPTECLACHANQPRREGETP